MGRAAQANLKTKIISAVVAVLAIAGGLSLYQVNSVDTSNNQKTQESSETDYDQKQPEGEVISYVGEQGKSALELLEENAEIETEETDFGLLVTSVNGRDGGGEKYWIYYVDGKMADVGAAEFETKDGQEIKWQLQ